MTLDRPTLCQDDLKHERELLPHPLTPPAWKHDQPVPIVGMLRTLVAGSSPGQVEDDERASLLFQLADLISTTC